MTDIEEKTVKKEPIGTETTFIEALAITNETLSLWRQLLAVSGIMLITFVNGITKSLWELHYDEFLSIYGLSMTQILGKIIQLRVARSMNLFGTIVAGFSMYFIGRRINILMASILGLMMVVILMSDSALKIMLAGYLLSEFVWAYTMVIFYVYVAEISDPRFRASFMGTNELLFHIALLLPDPFLQLYHIFLGFICLSLICLSVVLSVYAPESPYWLALTGRREMAENLFYHLHANSVDSTEVVNMCDEAERDAIWKAAGLHRIVSSPKFLIPLLIILFMIFSYGTMVNFGIGSLVNIISLTEEENPDLWDFWSDYLKITVSLYCSITGIIAFIWLALKIPRRILFISSVSLGLLILVPHLIIWAVISRFLLAICLYTYPLLYLFAYLGGNQLLRIIPVEIFPGPGRDLGSTIYFLLEFILDAFAHNAINLGFIKVKSVEFRWFMFPFGFFFTFLFMPETKNLSLIDAHNIGSDLKHIKLFFTITKLEVEENEEEII